MRHMSANEAARRFLLSALADGPRPAKEVLAEGLATGQFSERTLNGAKSALGIVSYRISIPGPWMWMLPGKNPGAHDSGPLPTLQERTKAVVNKGMYLVVMHVTPELAEQWLAQSGGNRKLDEGRVLAYETAMRNGDWKLTAQGIIFDVNGNLTNGHHRLEACKRSGVAVEFSVTYNQPPDARILEDGNRPMLPQHAFMRDGVTDVTSAAVAIARNIDSITEPLRKAPHYSPLEIGRRLNAWRAPIRYALATCHRVPGVSLAVHCLIARASGHADLDRLAEFASVFLNKGCVLNGETDSAAVKFYGLALRNTAGKGRQATTTMYQKGVSCVRAFLDGKDLKNINPSTVDVFPIVYDYSHVAAWLAEKHGDKQK